MCLEEYPEYFFMKETDHDFTKKKAQNVVCTCVWASLVI